MTLMPRCLFIAVICGFGLIFAADAQDGPKDAVVIIIRHADDADSGDGLSPLGQERADAYKNYFLNFTVDSKPREPTSFLPLKTQRRVIGRVLRWNHLQRQQI